MKKKVIIAFVIVAVSLLAVMLVVWPPNSTTQRKVVRFGAILPMTGNAANYGELMRKGISIAQDEFNNTRTSEQMRLEVIIEDSRSGPKDGVSALNKLINVDHVSAVMPALSSVVLSCVPICERNSVVLLNCPANSPKLRGTGTFVFNVTILSDQESEYLAKYAYREMGARSANILFINNDSGRGYRDSFATKFTALGGEVKLSEGQGQGATDFRSIVARFKNAPADITFMCSYYAETALFLRQCRELGFKSKWLSYASIETSDFLKLAGDTAEGIIYSQPGLEVNASDSITKYFVGTFRERYGEDPDFWSAQFYEGTRLLCAAVAAGAETGEEIRQFLIELKDFEGLGGSITFDNKRCITRTIRMKKISDGKFIYLGE
jgi:branched-chain amino acid transport system substrate-binding protein